MPEQDRTVAGADFEDLLREVLARVNGALDEQARLRLLLDAVVSMAADLTLDGVLARIVEISRHLTGAQYAALGVLNSGPRKGLRTFVHHGMTPVQVEEIGDLPTGHGILGLLIDRPEPLRLHEISAHPESYGFPAAPPADALLPRCAGPDPRPGLRQPLPDREDRERRLHPGGRGDRRRPRRGGGCGHRERPPLRGGRAPRGVAGGDGRDHRPALRVRRGRRGPPGRGRPSATGRRPPTWPGSCRARPATSPCGPSRVPRSRLAEMRGISMDKSLSHEVIKTGEPISIEDMTQDRRAMTMDHIAGWPTIGPAIVVPLRTGSERGRGPGPRLDARARLRVPPGRPAAPGELRGAGCPRAAGGAIAGERAAAGALRGPRPDRSGPARPRDPAALRRRAEPAERERSQ